VKYIVSEKYRFIYFVTQKVACSSIKRALLPCFPIVHDPYLFIDSRGVERVRMHKAFDESGFQIDKLILTSELDKYRNYFKFGFVRNPWDRLVSCYGEKVYRPNSSDPKEKCSLKSPRGEESVFYMCMPFEEFVERVYQIPDEEADAHFRSQSATFYGDEAGNILLADFIGRFENLDRDFENVKSRIGLDEKSILRHELKTRTRGGQEYQSFYNPRTRELVAQRYESDIRLFNYQFETKTG
jgi:chondroitin 4-sulfotransferase 11